MRLLCVTAIHDREPDVLLQNMKELGIKVVAATTHDRDYGVQSIVYPNAPLGAKWNAAAKLALSDGNWTHLLIMGDDNALHSSAIDYIKDASGHLFGFRSIHYVHPLSKRACLQEIPMGLPKVIGAGRVISREVFNKCCLRAICRVIDMDYAARIGFSTQVLSLTPMEAKYLRKVGGVVEQIDEGVELFPDVCERRLDFNSDMIFAKFGYLYRQLWTPEPVVVDVKTGYNMWTYSQVSTSKAEVDYESVLKRFKLCHDQICFDYGK